MTKPKAPSQRRNMSSLPIVAAVAALLIAVCACSDSPTERVADVDNLAQFPTMTTKDVSTWISDSGYTRYHITSEIWYIYDAAPRPYWTFPKGLYLEKYDNNFIREATLTCDSATYFSVDRLWRLDGNVRMRNTLGDRFLTQQLFWDQNEHTVYSDSFIHIEKSDRMIEGFGFRSNETMTQYTVNRPSGIFPIERQQPSDSTSQDSPARRSHNSNPNTGAAPAPVTSANGTIQLLQ